uniref:Uncharacterized protein n=1 Tax=Panagrolaimus sp. PS1159 TaxID=55785 RepID=A0AC35FG92_9BILA
MANFHELSVEPPSSSSSEEEGNSYEKEYQHLKVLSRVVVVPPNPNMVKIRELDELLKKLNDDVLEVKRQQQAVLNLVIQAIDELNPTDGALFKGIKDSLSKAKSKSDIKIGELESQNK